jgi:hypothetical protein
MSILTATNKAFFRYEAEEIVYRPAGGDEDDDRTIRAVVDRKPPEQIAEIGSNVQAKMVLVVRNVQAAVADDSFGGISSDELDTGGDTLTLPERVGGTARAFRIVQLIDHDDGMLTLGVR